MFLRTFEAFTGIDLSTLGVFTFEIKWAPFKCLFWNANDSIVNLMVSLGYSSCYKIMLNNDNDNKWRKVTTI